MADEAAMEADAEEEENGPKEEVTGMDADVAEAADATIPEGTEIGIEIGEQTPMVPKALQTLSRASTRTWNA